ncbi:hypothetical protein NVP1198B_03 [Vibrio phage 1.198.B._10N.286.54.F4]|nr:hypothetical protein NVP1198A_03 [Vibrio phage 1.198.A._10N.286.54.F4]AUR94791.1 hypothetical protein NVP1198B_03 [Vibrio phage 1.198.B._10N.286.54.F4]
MITTLDIRRFERCFFRLVSGWGVTKTVKFNLNRYHELKSIVQNNPSIEEWKLVRLNMNYNGTQLISPKP